MDNMHFQAGAGREVLSFPHGYFPLEGFAGIHDEICVKALILKKEEEIVIVSMELPSLKPYSLIDEMKDEVFQITGTKRENIWICVTHNVSAPHVPPHNCPPDEESLKKQKLHIAMVKEAVKKAVTQAAENLQDAKIGAAEGHADVNVNRDIPTGSGWWLGIQGTGFSDKSLFVLRVDNMKGEPLALIYQYAVKTAVIDDAKMSDGNRYVTADLTGEACRVAEKALKAPVLYFMGAAGDQVPVKKAQYYVTDDKGQMVSVEHHEKGFAWVKELGEILGKAVIETAVHIDCRDNFRLETDRLSFWFPGQKGYPRNLPYGPIKEYQYIPDKEQEVCVEILRIDDVVILGVKPEVTSIIGAELRKRSPFSHTVLATMVNGGMNYMADKEEYDRFAFEGTHSVLARGAAELFVEKMTEALKEKKQITEDTAEKKTAWAYAFRPCEEYGIWYRLYEPKEKGPRPMIVYLHGGGESGDDNWKQLTNQLGAAYLAEQYSSFYVLAPQTPVDKRKLEEKGKKIAYSESRMYGWTREYLSVLCRIIRDMIRDGRVDKDRVFLTGAARGGGGAILALDVAPDLFAAAVPICPRMTPEVSKALLKMKDQKIWISIPYADESLERNKYIVEGVLALKDAGNRHIHLTIYSPEELAKYGLGTDETMPLEERLKENHKAWILTYHNEHGILDWLVNQKKETKEEETWH